MQWQGRRESGNIEDRRGTGSGGVRWRPRSHADRLPERRWRRRCGGGLGIVGVIIMLGHSVARRDQPARSPAPATATSAMAISDHRAARSARRPTSRASSSPRCSPTPRTPGASIFSARASTTRSRRWCCSAASTLGAAASPDRDGGPFYCPGRPQGLHRPRLLRRARAALPGARRFRRRPTSSPTRSATTCRTCSASCTRSSSARSSGDADANALSVRTRAAGRLLRRHLGASRRRTTAASSSRATSTRR